MIDTIQYEKAKKKVEILSDIVKKLINYNNMTNYNNPKEFTIKINYIYDENKCYNYKVNILRGTKEPKNILSLNIKYKDRIDDLLLYFMKDLCSNVYFNYTSYSKEYFTLKNKYNINMKNGVKIVLPIYNDMDKELYQQNEINIEERIVKEYYNVENVSLEEKNILQHTKALKVISLIEDVFEKIGELNSIEKYNNKKPYKLKIICDKDEINDCYKYLFKIIRGKINESTFLDFSTSIRNKDIIYNKLFKILNNYEFNSSYPYPTLNNNIDYEIYNLYLNNELEIEIICKELEDKLFFRKLLKFDTDIIINDNNIKNKVLIKNED